MEMGNSVLCSVVVVVVVCTNETYEQILIYFKQTPHSPLSLSFGGKKE